jgi:hypothetical protein
LVAARPRTSKASRRVIHVSKPLIDRLWVPTREELSQFEGDARAVYNLARVSRSLFDQRVVWRVSVRVPAYDVVHSLRVELEQFSQAVYVEDWTGEKLKHTYGGNRLCMWYPSDPPAKKWSRLDGLLKLIDTAIVHLFKEYHLRETGQWLGEEAPHDVPKRDGPESPMKRRKAPGRVGPSISHPS